MLWARCVKKERWLLNEIDLWRQSALIDADTAEKLRQRYTPKKNINQLIVMFSVIGSLLIGAGIILILAKNWQDLHIALRVTLAFLPLAASQALAVYTVKFKYESLAWRESVAIFMTAAIFAANALIGQIFHLPGDYGTYVLVCGLLSLPVIFILNAVSPLAAYYWTILNWAALNHSSANALILLVLFALGVMFLIFKQRQDDSRLVYISWLTVAAGFVLVLILGCILDCSLLLTVLCYFILLLAVEKMPEHLLLPFKIIGTIGGLVTVAILTYQGMWSYIEHSANAGSNIMIGIMLAAALFFAVMVFKQDKLKFSLVAILILLSAARYIWALYKLDDSPYDFILSVVSNLVLLAIGTGFIVHGVKNFSLTRVNIGMAAVCTLIIMRFFDSDMDFFWRGIVFLMLGAIFLLVNLKILRVIKQRKQEPQI